MATAMARSPPTASVAADSPSPLEDVSSGDAGAKPSIAVVGSGVPFPGVNSRRKSSRLVPAAHEALASVRRAGSGATLLRRYSSGARILTVNSLLGVNPLANGSVMTRFGRRSSPALSVGVGLEVERQSERDQRRLGRPQSDREQRRVFGRVRSGEHRRRTGDRHHWSGRTGEGTAVSPAAPVRRLGGVPLTRQIAVVVLPGRCGPDLRTVRSRTRHVRPLFPGDSPADAVTGDRACDTHDLPIGDVRRPSLKRRDRLRIDACGHQRCFRQSTRRAGGLVCETACSACLRREDRHPCPKFALG